MIRLDPALMSRVSLGPVGASPAAASQYARLSPSQQMVICSLVTTADTYVAAGAPSGPASAVSARAAAWTAVCDAAAGSSPRCTPSASSFIPVRTAISDASSGRGAEETPSDTIATATWPASVGTTAMWNASSFRWWRRPRSLTPTTWPRSRSTWSALITSGWPHDKQRPSGPARTGSPESAEHAGHCLALGESSRDVLISPLLSAGGVSRSPGH